MINYLKTKQKRGLILLTLKASQTGPHNDVVCSCTLNGSRLGDGIVRDAVLNCPDMSNSLSFSGGKIPWCGSVVGKEDRGGEGVDM